MTNKIAADCCGSCEEFKGCFKYDDYEKIDDIENCYIPRNPIDNPLSGRIKELEEENKDLVRIIEDIR